MSYRRGLVGALIAFTFVYRIPQPFYPACAQLLDAFARIVIIGRGLKGQFSSVVPRFEIDLLFLVALGQKRWRGLAASADRYKRPLR